MPAFSISLLRGPSPSMVPDASNSTYLILLNPTTCSDLDPPNSVTTSRKFPKSSLSSLNPLLQNRSHLVIPSQSPLHLLLFLLIYLSIYTRHNRQHNTARLTMSYHKRPQGPQPTSKATTSTSRIPLHTAAIAFTTLSDKHASPRIRSITPTTPQRPHKSLQPFPGRPHHKPSLHASHTTAPRCDPQPAPVDNQNCPESLPQAQHPKLRAPIKQGS